MKELLNKKKYLIIFILIVVLIFILVISIYIKSIFFTLKEGDIVFKDKEIKVFEEIYLSTLIEEDVELVKDIKIDTEKVGTTKIEFEYIEEERHYLGYINVKVIDDVAPTIFINSTYTIPKGKDKDFVNSILSGDNYDNEPIRKIIGEYDKDTVGTYNLTYYIEDSSGNVTTKDFKVKVVEKINTSKNNSSKVYFNNVINKYKTDDTEIGIDVSKWQGTINFEKVKEAGCSFVIMRLGYQNGLDGDMILDPYFKENIEKATNVGLDIGVYIYTYAKTEQESISQAKWAIKQLNGYKLKYGISYDWESWTLFNKTKLSYYNFNKVANTFLDYVETKGYKGMLYSSKYYLENVWSETKHDVWLAHYTSETDYKGKYKMWQMTSSGRIDGINGAVDINILYKNN